jgi:hypothetical protein
METPATLISKVSSDLLGLAKPSKVATIRSFFKTGKGEYGEGDEFIGVNVPNIRTVCKKYFVQASFSDLDSLLADRIHEQRSG